MSKNSQNTLNKDESRVRKKLTIWIAISVIVLLAAVAVCIMVFFNNREVDENDIFKDLPVAQTGENTENNEFKEVDDPEESNDEMESEPRMQTLNGLEIVNIYINDELHLIKVLSDGTEFDAGVVKAESSDRDAGTFTVTFMNYDGGVLKEQIVGSGGSATPPVDPVREGFTFLGWKGVYENVTADSTVVAMFLSDGKEPNTYTVTFQDYDGTVLDTQIVPAGGIASVPEAPEREGYDFSGWDTRFSPVFDDQIVTAQYVLYTENADMVEIDVGSARAPAGETVQITVSLRNNPGLLGMELGLVYDDANLTLINVANGTATSDMDLTKPGVFRSGCSFVWDSTDVIDGDGTCLELTFQIADSAVSGVYPIEIHCGDTPMVNENLEALIPIVRNGAITVSK